MSNSPAEPMACCMAPWSVLSIPMRRPASDLPTTCAASAVRGAKALPGETSRCKYAELARSSAPLSPACNAAMSSVWKVWPDASLRPSTSKVFNASGTVPLLMLISDNNPKIGHPVWPVAAHGTSNNTVITGEASCSTPVNNSANAVGSSMLAKDKSCKANFPRPQSSAASGVKAPTAFNSPNAASKAADMASRPGKSKGDPPGAANKDRKHRLAPSHPAALGPAEQPKSTGGSAAPPACNPIAACPTPAPGPPSAPLGCADPPGGEKTPGMPSPIPPCVAGCGCWGCCI
mmetsp:Transcript_25013/g.75156  ORF Transcript_25013/g.75156 Transcript_25013/m.75156 type:complete len:290 (-) Transcript_25013:189-1058(-)